METKSSPPSPTPSELSSRSSSKNKEIPLHQMPSKSRSNSLCKSLVVVLLLLFAIPMLPSRAPDFVTQRILSDTWEIIHLCLIGLAVSYGLFSRKRSGAEPEMRNAAVSSKEEEGCDYLSGFLFDDGFDDFRGGDAQSYANCQCLLTGEGRFVGREKCVVHGSRNLRSLASENGYEEKENQEWKLRYSKGESLVIVSNGVSDFKPLNLPIRSLKSVARDIEEEEDEEREAEKMREISSKTEAKGARVGNRAANVRGVIPRNLDNRFEEIAGDSRRSKSVRLQKEEEMKFSKEISRSRPRSAGEFEFVIENLESGNSIRGSKISSNSPEFGSSNSDNAADGGCNNPRKRIFVLHPKREVFGGSGDEDEESRQKNRSFGASEGERKSSNLDAKSPSLVKALSKAKSVRTVKPRRFSAIEKEKRSVLEMKDEAVVRSFDDRSTKPTALRESCEEKDIVSDKNLTESEDEEEDAENVSEKHLNHHDDDFTDLGSEVDRKAGEFIAKFREQIRLQKISSARKRSGQGIEEQQP